MKEFLSYYFDAHKQSEEIRRWIVDKFINKIYLSENEIVIMFKYTDNPKSDYLCVGYNMVHKCNDSAHQISGQLSTKIYRTLISIDDNIRDLYDKYVRLNKRK